MTLLAILLLQYLFKKTLIFKGDTFIRNLFSTLIAFLGMMLVIFSLPISSDSKQIIVSAIGIIVGATVALSSTTFVSNGMSGIMIRLIKPFYVGDYIRSGDIFGRVTDKTILYTRIQSEYRDLITVPNLKIMSNPLTTIRSSGTIISTNVSLGYDVCWQDIETALLKAADETGLKDPFVHVLELGDFSVTYKVGGLLKETKALLTDRSNFKKAVLDSLHRMDIEIVSPTFMNQRVMKNGKRFIPPLRENKKDEVEFRADRDYIPRVSTEEIIFDKAIEAEMLDKARKTLEYFDNKKDKVEKQISCLPDESAKIQQNNWSSIKDRLGNIEQIVEALEKAPGPGETGSSPEGLLHSKVLEHLRSIMDSILEDYNQMVKTMESESCEIEDKKSYELSDSEESVSENDVN
ncbi:MAG: mechanosensitive ion channel family protein [Methanohalophilus sp.]